jgi:6-phosphogluconolactonase
MSTDRSEDGAGVYTQTNDPGGNQIIAYRRAADGTLTPLGAYDTGGLGTGKPHLASQGSVVLSGDGRWLFAVNAGSDDLSVLAVAADGLALVDRVDAGGVRPTSVAGHHDLLYVLSTGSASDPAGLHGFKISDDGRIAPLEGSRRQLSQPDADPAQIGFSPDGGTLVVTERATDSISSYVVGQDGRAEGPTVVASSGATPYGFDFTRAGVWSSPRRRAANSGPRRRRPTPWPGRARCRWSAARSVTRAARSAGRRSAPTTAISM